MVALVARNKVSLQSLVEEVNQTAGKAVAFMADVIKPDEVASIFTEIHEQDPTTIDTRNGSQAIS